MKTLIFIFVVSALIDCALLSCTDGCGPNEVKNTCGSPCVGERTCQNRNPTTAPGTQCIALCVERCECDASKGYIRSGPNGTCIKEENCQTNQECGPNEVKTTCASACVGERTCQDRNPSSKPGTPCILLCVQRCECDASKGYIRSGPNGTCIKEENCQTNQECGPNEVKTTCASACVGERTCQDRNPSSKPGTPCILLCVQRCECDASKGYIRSGTNGTCIKEENCQTNQECGLNEIKNTCASACKSEPTCQDRNPTIKPGTACITVCVERCECDASKGYIRSGPNGTCIKKENCRSREIVCPKHQSLICTSPCHLTPTCQQRNPKPPKGLSCGGLCIRKCQCNAEEGYIADEVSDTCVKISDCPK